MSLRLQLLAVGLLTLVLPWAGCRYVEEMEGVLRSGLEQSLLASALTTARALEASLPPVHLDLRPPVATLAEADQSAVYAHPLPSAPRIDGYIDDWPLDDAFARRFGGEHRYWAGVHDRHLYLFLDVLDPTVIYQAAPSATPYGDRVLLHLGWLAQPWLLLHTAAPGTVRAMRTQPPQFAPEGALEDRVLGAWAERPNGYRLELRLPLDLVGPSLGLAVIDVDPGEQADTFDVALLTSWDPEKGGPGRFIYRPRSLAAAASPFEQSGRRLRVVDPEGWVLFDAGALDPAPTDPAEPGLMEALYRFILRRDDPSYRELEAPPGYLADPALRNALSGSEVARWYRRGAELSAVVAAAVPIGTDEPHGAVIVEQGSDSILTLTNLALAQLMGFTLLASFIASAALFGYATVLSLRIGKLSRAASAALGPRGEIAAALPGRGARDEIGDLARSFTDLLRRLGEYTEYLRTLKGKLVHELRTPLAVVATSLENVEREPHGPHLEPYLTRMREGTQRIDALIQSMSEATAIERAIADTATERFDLAKVVTECVTAYRDVHPDRRFDLQVDAGRTQLAGSADLIAQMLDKLIDNAVSFSKPDATITVSLTEHGKELVLAVSNPGPRLPSTMRSQLFDSLVSVRAGAAAGRKHLGLGLYIVALIARHHGGRVDAKDLPDGSGVTFEIFLPAPAG